MKRMILNGFKYKRLYFGLTICLTLFLYAAPLFAGNATLSWNPPTTNADGTPLTDLAGFIIYDGTATGVYSYSTNVGNVTTYQVGNLTEGFTYYFAITAYDTSGNESEYSYEVSKTIAPRAIYSISGTVNESGSRRMPGSSITGVTITLSGAAAVTTTTDASGDYTFSGLSDGSYTVTSSLAGYTFTPVSRAVTISGANRTGQNFTGTPGGGGGGTYSISGTVNEPGSRRKPGSPIAGVTITLSGAAASMTTTDGSGNYTFSGLSNGSYAVTPSPGGYTFTPTSRAVIISGANRTGQDFTGIATDGGIYSIETPEKEETVQEETTIEPFPVESVGSEEISSPSDIDTSEFSKKQVYSIQVGAFANKRNAVSLVEKLKQKGYNSFILKQSRPGGKILHKVLIGKFDRRKEALESSRILLQKQDIETFIYSY